MLHEASRGIVEWVSKTSILLKIFMSFAILLKTVS